MKFTLYPVYWIADLVDDEQFDLNRLPFDITENVRLENVSGHFRGGAFALWAESLGQDIVGHLEDVKYALVHRYHTRLVDEQQQATASETLLRNLAACLRLIRPMRQHALLMRGDIRDEDNSFDVHGFDIPTLHLMEVPVVQRLFKLRNRDADDLRGYAPRFLDGMQGRFWKFRMAVQFHELGHFQPFDWKARYLLWCSAIESIYSSHNWEHQGSLVATSRIKWFLGDKTSIYPPGDISELLTDPHITVGEVVGDLYAVRNFIAHGDRIPDHFSREVMRHDFSGAVRKIDVMLEAASFVIRTSLLKILRDNLLDHFAEASAAEAYFGGQGLTRTALRAVQKAAQKGAKGNP
jgi:hypothetical protein